MARLVGFSFVVSLTCTVTKKLRFSFFFLIVYSVNFIQYFSAFEDRRKIVEFS